MLRFTLIAALVSTTLAACAVPQECVARGASTSYSGSASYTGQTGGGDVAPAPTTGSVPASIVVYDVTPACTYDGMEFTISVGGCLVWATLDSANSEGGVGLTASIEPGQRCALATATTPITVSLSSGVLTIDTTAQLTLAGTVVPSAGALDAGVGPGYLEWSFLGE